MTHGNDTWKAQGACRDEHDLFQSPALDYDPSGDDYAALTDEEHAELADLKATVERQAVDVCMGCPVLFQCEAWALANAPVYGVAGGRTEGERTEIAEERGLEPAAPVTEVTNNCRDRGPRHQVDDSTVAWMTAQGFNARYIAQEMGCAERTIVRARARLARAAEMAPADDAPVYRVAEVAKVTEVAEVAAAPAPTTMHVDGPGRGLGGSARHLDSGTMSAASPAMRAVYAALADGGWHQRDTLLDVAVQHIADVDALAWWTRVNSKTVGGARVLNPSRVGTPKAERVRAGARDKANNMLSASCRVRRHTERGGPSGADKDLYRLAAAPTAQDAPTVVQAALSAA